jgi:hypothetical protein
LALVLALTLRFALLTASVATRHSDGFGAYYTSARLLHAGVDVARFYDDQWFNTQVGFIVPGVQDIYTPNPPPTAALLLPLARLSYGAARTIWTLLSALILGMVIFWLAREARLPNPWALAFAALALLFEPVITNMRQGQAYVFLLSLTAITWHGYRTRRDGMAGIALGLMLVFKTAGILLPLLFLWRRRWRALAATCVTILVVVLASLLTMGQAAWRTYLDVLPKERNEPDFMVTAYQTQYSLLHHLFVFDARWNPNPLFRQPALGGWLSLLATIVVLAIIAYVLQRSRSGDLSFGAFVIASIVISPFSLDYHYTLLLLPIALLVSRLSRSGARWSWLVLGAGLFLIAAPLPYLSERFSVGAWALLAYPRLYGALLLLALTLRESNREETAPKLVTDDSSVVANLAWNDV